MIPPDFTIAMRNSFARGPFHQPSELTDFALEWLIVERKGRFLAVSDAGSVTPEQAKQKVHRAPDDLSRNNTLVATLIEFRHDTGEQLYLFSQFPITTGLTQGQFFPGEGYARLCARDGEVALSVHGRHAHRRLPDGSFENAGQPGPGAGGINWHFDALRCPWSQEIFNQEV